VPVSKAVIEIHLLIFEANIYVFPDFTLISAFLCRLKIRMFGHSLSEEIPKTVQF
jgi:hypothetical protein